LRYGADAFEQVFPPAVLEQIPGSPGQHRRLYCLSGVVGGEHQHFGLGQGALDLPAGVDAVDFIHEHVHQHHIGLEPQCLVYCLFA
jgi:hypothetical protein